MCGSKPEGTAVFKFPTPDEYSRNLIYVRNKHQYNYAFLSKIESNDDKINKFYEMVIF
jgi:hypothetical protein